MSTQKEQYDDIMTLILEDPEIRDIFNKKATDGLLDRNLASDVLSEWSIALGQDFEQANIYFDLNNSPLPPEQLPDQIDFDSFVSIFQQWLAQNFDQKPEQVQEQEKPQFWFKDENQQPTNPSMDTEQSDLKQQELLIKVIFETKEDQTKRYFQEYAALSETGDKITKSDFPLILKNLLYQQNCSIYEKDGVDYFMQNNSYQYLQKYLRDDHLTYEQFREAAKALIRANPNLIVMDNDKAQSKIQREPKAKNLEEDLLHQIEKYEQILQRTETEIEKQVLRNMITTLVRQLDIIRDSSIKIDNSMAQNTTIQKRNLQISFSGIARPEARQKTKEEQEIEKIDKRLNEIFLFFCKQQYVNGIKYEFDRYTKEAQKLSLGMFLYFCNSFGLIGQKHREPLEKNLLERKKRGEGVDIPDVKKKAQAQEEQTVELKKVENLPRKNKYGSVPSKFEWWNDELNFEKFYKANVNHPAPPKPGDLVYLTRDEIKNLFKRSSFGKDLDFDEYKCLLGFMANKMFKQDDGSRHPHAYQRLLELLYINNLEEYRQRLIPIKIPFNCTEKPGFRALPGTEYHQYKSHQLSEQEKERLKQLKAEREQYLKEKLNDQVNSSIRSVGSLRSMNPNYQGSQLRLNGKIDLDREKVSWAKLENLNPNDLSGQGRNFKPQDLIDEFEDEEDKFFLKEFSLEEEKVKPRPEDIKKTLENYGVYKPPKRPTQKNTQSQPNLLGSSPNERYSNPIDIKKQYMQRANQIQNQQNQREQQIMKSINNKQYKL